MSVFHALWPVMMMGSDDVELHHCLTQGRNLEEKKLRLMTWLSANHDYLLSVLS